MKHQKKYNMTGKLLFFILLTETAGYTQGLELNFFDFMRGSKCHDKLPYVAENNHR